MGVSCEYCVYSTWLLKIPTKYSKKNELEALFFQLNCRDCQQDTLEIFQREEIASPLYNFDIPGLQPGMCDELVVRVVHDAECEY